MVAYDYVIMNPGYVHIIKQQYVDELREKLRKYNIFTLGRYGGWTYNSMEDCGIQIGIKDEKWKIFQGEKNSP